MAISGIGIILTSIPHASSSTFIDQPSAVEQLLAAEQPPAVDVHTLSAELQAAASEHSCIKIDENLLFHEKHCLKKHLVNDGTHINLNTVANGLAFFEPSATYAAGVCFSLGLGVHQDATKAMSLFELVAYQGNAFTQYECGTRLYDGIGISINTTLAAICYRESANKGFAPAQCKYGFCLEFGEGVDVNTTLAVDYYKKSAEQQYAPGMFRYGLCLENGVAVKKNLELAAAYYKASADAGDVVAQFAYGRCLMYGIGVETDFIVAAQYYDKSAAQEYAEAARQLAALPPFARLLGQNDTLAATKAVLRYVMNSGDVRPIRALLAYGALEEEERTTLLMMGTQANDFFCAKTLLKCSKSGTITFTEDACTCARGVVSSSPLFEWESL
ncbi:MAG: sel1 repeat family protein [Holosporales bacterium]|nr:sel1 repeat family protein [Holosporales bacterium]